MPSPSSLSAGCEFQSHGAYERAGSTGRAYPWLRAPGQRPASLGQGRISQMASNRGRSAA